MYETFMYLGLALVGAIFGSFAGATVWRLRARQLVADKRHGEKVNQKEFNHLRKLTKKSLLNDRSRCLHCSYTLKWYDMIPVVSWLSLGGKCRNCRKPIGSFEILMELGLALYFVLVYALWPLGLTTGLEWAHFGLWLAAGVVLAMIFAYDMKWFLILDGLSLTLALIGLAAVATVGMQTGDWGTIMLQASYSIAILSGLYFVLFLVSGGRWVGFGDVKLGIGLALLLADWKLALLALFLANLIGTLVVVPLLASKKLGRKSHVPFGPLLIAGTVVAWLIGAPLLDWYLGLLGL